jgi:hypothetical protein
MRSPLAAAGMCLVAAPAYAAGGHFDVDDATVLDPGHCQYKAWVVRAPAAGATFARLGPGCRIGPLVDKLSAGLAWNMFFDLTNHGRPTQTFYAPFTWSAAEKLWVHANIGLDRDAAGTRWRRQGLSGEWAASDKFTVIAERVKIVGDWTSRLGGRFNISETLSVDLSAARFGLRGERIYVIGLNQEFAR